ncbi:MAG: hypothetical protein D6761_06080, partial [Candidatus Dadabacteria bacterium]
MMRFRTVLLLIIAVAGCTTMSPPERCTPNQPFPYPDGDPYPGTHAGPGNADWVDCETAPRYIQRWRTLEGLALFHPATLAPDGRTLYATTTNPDPDGCRLYAVAARTGRVRWCRVYPPGILDSAVEVDLDGHLYFTIPGAVVSLDARGRDRWRTALPARSGATTPVPLGLHFGPGGEAFTVTDQGVVFAIDRTSGKILDTLDIAATWDLEVPETALDPAALLAIFPSEIREDLELTFGAGDDGARQAGTTLGAGGAFVSNTITVSSRNDLFIVGGGPDEDHGAVVKLSFDPKAQKLQPGWLAPITGASSSSPAISIDGRFLIVGDGVSLASVLEPAAVTAHVVVIDVDACDANHDALAAANDCAPAQTWPLERGPATASLPLASDNTIYAWEAHFFDFETALDPGLIDLRAWTPDGPLWQARLPNDLTWSSVMTVTRNHLIGTASRGVLGNETLLGFALPETVESVLVVIDRATGSLVSSAPVIDGAVSTVVVGRDG